MAHRSSKKISEKDDLFGIPLPGVRLVLTFGAGVMILLLFLSQAFNTDEIMRSRMQAIVQKTLNVAVGVGGVEAVPEQKIFRAAAVAIGNPQGVEPSVGMLVGGVEADILHVTENSIELAQLALQDVVVDVHVSNGAVSLVSFHNGINRLSSLDEARAQQEKENDAPTFLPLSVRIGTVLIAGGRIHMTIDGRELEAIDLPPARFTGPGAGRFPVTVSEAVADVTEGLIRQIMMAVDQAGALDSLGAARLKDVRARYDLGRAIQEKPSLPSGWAVQIPAAEEASPALLLRDDIPAKTPVP